MGRLQRKISALSRFMVAITIILGLAGQANSAWGIDLSQSFKELKQTLDQRIYFRETNEKVFAHAYIPQTPNNPKNQVPTYSPCPPNPEPGENQARGTRLFADFPKPENFDSEAFQADLERLKSWAEDKLGKEAVAVIIKTGKGLAKEIQDGWGNRKELKKQIQSKIEEVREKGKNIFVVRPEPESKPKRTTSEIRVKKSLFEPERERLEDNSPPQHPFGLVKEKKF